MKVEITPKELLQPSFPAGNRRCCRTDASWSQRMVVVETVTSASLACVLSPVEILSRWKLATVFTHQENEKKVCKSYGFVIAVGSVAGVPCPPASKPPCLPLQSSDLNPSPAENRACYPCEDLLLTSVWESTSSNISSPKDSSTFWDVLSFLSPKLAPPCG